MALFAVSGVPYKINLSDGPNAAISHQDLKRASVNDSLYQCIIAEVKEWHKRGDRPNIWPVEYQDVCDKLTLHDGLFYFKGKIVVPDCESVGGNIFHGLKNLHIFSFIKNLGFHVG